ncbi:MAG: glutamate formimidoyltransferase [Planctomycetes bacterium]|nr:glutamate formimidoyltransferase [Planctomycetota bacterium]
MTQLVECVPNFSEGRRTDVVSQIVAAIGSVPAVKILDEQMDMDHNRAVITFIGPPESVRDAAWRGAEQATALIDMNRHTGAHPRIGATDVVPFVPLSGTSMEECVALAAAFGEELARRLGIPVYLYGEAARRAERKDLGTVRRGELEALREELGRVPERAPDFGPARLHDTAGATAVGARMPLIAYNVYLAEPDARVSKKIAKKIRTSSGGMPFLMAKGVDIPSRGLSQVTMNLTNFRVTSLGKVFETIVAEATAAGVQVVESEIVGLVPRESMEGLSPEHLLLPGWNGDRIIENRLQA